MIPIVAFRFVSFIRLGPFLCPLLPTLASLPLLSYLSTSPLSSPPAFHPSLKNNRRQPAVRSAVWPPTHRNPAPPCFSFSPLPFWLVSRLCPASFLRPFTTLPDSALRLSCPASAPSCLGSFALHLVTSWSNLGSWPRFQSVRLAKKKNPVSWLSTVVDRTSRRSCGFVCPAGGGGGRGKTQQKIG